MWAPAAFFLLAVFLSPRPAPESAGPPLPGEADRLARRIHERGKYPSVLPGAGPAWEGENHRRRARGRHPFRAGPSRRPLLPPPVSIEAPFGSLIAWLLVGLGGSMLAFLALRLLKDLPSQGRSGGRAERGRGSPHRGRAVPPGRGEGEVRPDPEELAAQGRFGPAVQALFLSALAHSGWSGKGREKGLTAREIVARIPEGESLKAPLARLLALAEGIHFAGKPASKEVYQEARNTFRLLVSLAGDSTESSGGGEGRVRGR